MMKRSRRTSGKAILFLVALCSGAARAAEWTEPVEVRHDLKRCVSYRARLSGEFLVIQAAHEPGWHTYALDNKQRAAGKLAGRQSLGIDGPTEITLSEGLEAAGPWHQSRPKDLSKPEILWFSWGFEHEALFVAKVRRSGAGPAQIAIRGQACTETTCKKVDVTVSLPLAGAEMDRGGEEIDFKALVAVR